MEENPYDAPLSEGGPGNKLPRKRFSIVDWELAKLLAAVTGVTIIVAVIWGYFFPPFH
jgi:hypothetical protein